MPRRLRYHVNGNPPDTGSFRRLVEREITVDEYVDRLDERVRERHETEEAPVPGGRRDDDDG